MFLFRRKKPLAPPVVLTDKIVPVHYWDHYCVDAVMNFMLRFDHKLDAGKLRGSLEKVLDRRDGWRKLGARVRLNASGKLDYHIPDKYTKQRPAISYHHRPYDMNITQHPLASRILSASASSSVGGSPQIVGRSDDLVSLMRRPDDPTCFEDYLYTDRPMLGLHIVTFNDATLVSLYSSHILFDAMGRKELLNAWSLTLQGREDEVIPLIENDPLAMLGSQKETTTTESSSSSSSLEQYKHASKQLGLLQLITLGLRQALDKVLHRNPIEETRIIRVPTTYVDALRKDALSALQPHNNNHIEKQATPKAFLSDGDILCAWWTRHIISSRIPNASTSNQTISIMNMMGLRRLLSQEQLLPTEKSALVANAMVAIPAFMPAKNIVTKPLGHVAISLRKAIEQLGTRPQVEALMALQRAANDKKGGPPALFGDGGMHMVVCTNWTKAGFYDVDFSAAIIDNQEKIPVGVGVARPTNVLMHLITASTPAFMLSIFSILGRDVYGNYWIMGILRKGYWARIEEAFRGNAFDVKH